VSGEEKSNVNTMVIEKPDGKISFGKSRHSWEGNTETDLK
jgi:hypothetical protein